MDVSIIIVNYNTIDVTRNCIDSVIKQTEGLTYEIILVDNASTDGSKEYFSNDHRIRYIYSFENLGFGRANNLGMILSKGEYIFLLNSDTILLNNAVYEFYSVVSKDKELNFYGSWLLNRDQSIGLSYGEEPTFTSMFKRLFLPYLHVLKIKKVNDYDMIFNEERESIKEVGYVSGADMFFSRRIFERYNAFDHNFFMYFEEAEWQKRVKKLGVKSYILNSPRIVHLQGGSDNAKRKNMSIKSLVMMNKSRKYFLYKYYGKVPQFLFSVAYFLLKSPEIIVSSEYRLSDKLYFIKNI